MPDKIYGRPTLTAVFKALQKAARDDDKVSELEEVAESKELNSQPTACMVPGGG